MKRGHISAADFELLARMSAFFSDTFVELGLETKAFSDTVKESIANYRSMHARGEHRSRIMTGMREGLRDYLSDGSEELNAQQIQELSCRFYSEFEFQISELDNSWPDCQPG